MATAKIYLDNRSAKDQISCPVKLIVSHKGANALLRLGFKADPRCWDGGRFIGEDYEQYNKVVENSLDMAKAVIQAMELSGELNDSTVIQLRNQIALSLSKKVQTHNARKTHGVIIDAFNDYMELVRSKSTRQIYATTLRKMQEFDEDLKKRRFEDIDRKYLVRFQNHLESTMERNSSNIYLRSLRAVFNSAIEDEKTTAYPFRKFKIKAQATKDRSLTADELRELFAFPCAEWQQEYVDIFKLMFCLCGINMGDLALLESTDRSRIEYNRQKTGKHYSIKIEPEAQEIIDKYRGETHLLSILDRYKSYSDYLHHMNDALKTVGKTYVNGRKPTGRALFPEISTYYARYAWASIAAELDIPRETIAAALGHTQMGVTAIYIRTDMKRKIDMANRRVLDYVFG